MAGRTFRLGSLLSAIALSGVGHAADLRIREQWPLTGPVSWDYLAVDKAGAHLFVTRNSQVDVLDTQTGKVVATIHGTSGAHGVALAESAKRGYVSNGKSDSVTMFDLESFKTLREGVVTGHNPDAILYDSASNRLFTFNGRSSDLTVLSPDDLHVVGSLKLPGKPEFAVADDQGLIFVNIETEPGQMAVIDSKSLILKSIWQLPGCNSPSGLSLDKAHQRLFSVCDDKALVVTDARSGRQTAAIRIGDGPDAVAYDSTRALVYSSNGEGSLTVIHQDGPDRYSVVQTLATKKGSRTMALDPASGAVFLSSADFAPTAAPARRPAASPDSFAVLKVAP